MTQIPKHAKFIWAVDRDGYDLSRDRTRIKRRGGVMAPYVPDAMQPPIHRVFAGPGGPATPDGALEFVRRFGFLGAADRGADAVDEPVEWLKLQHTRLRKFDFFFDPDAKQGPGSFDQFNADAPGHLSVRIELDSAGVPQLEVVPRTLIGWIWLATGRELTGEGRWARCAYPSCGKLFEVGRDTRTHRRRYCSDSHRASDARRRRQEGAE